MDNNTFGLLTQVGAGGIFILAFIFILGKFILPNFKKDSTGIEKKDDHTDVILSKLDQIISHHNDFYGEFKECNRTIQDHFKTHKSYVDELNKGWALKMDAVVTNLNEQSYFLKAISTSIEKISENNEKVSENLLKTNIILDTYLKK